MNLRLVLPLVTFLATPALFAQGGTTTPEPVRIEERMEGEGTINVEPEPEAPAPEAGQSVFTIVEKMPEFPGGQEALMKYLSSRIEYPEEAMRENIEGAVFISFIVEQDGRISNVKSLRGLGGGLTEEAIRVVKGMPNWLPGKQRGAPVRVQYNLPIRFKL
ncbi:MAG: energy transducer TonB [Flavobacteriales bacterium]|nr:energy transducer TonB [Flavobacteriales bacterium]